MVHRFFVPSDSFQREVLVLRGDQAHQIHDVLRLHEGEVIGAVDEDGSEYRVELTRVARGTVQGRVLDRIFASREPRTRLVLYQSLLKADKFEWVLQKGTEIGVAEFVPVVCSRAVVGSVGRAKQARWERIIVEAAEQSGRSKIPPLHPIQHLEDALKDARVRGGTALIPWEEERESNLRSFLVKTSQDSSVSLFIGPEGGFDATEIETARGYEVHPVTLGRRILRAETACLVAVSAIFFYLGEFDVG
jgi:16S rRNA (uracil1498-N3)-methyltransferase